MAGISNRPAGPSPGAVRRLVATAPDKRPSLRARRAERGPSSSPRHARSSHARAISCSFQRRSRAEYTTTDRQATPTTNARISTACRNRWLDAGTGADSRTEENRLSEPPSLREPDTGGRLTIPATWVRSDLDAADGERRGRGTPPANPREPTEAAGSRCPGANAPRRRRIAGCPESSPTRSRSKTESEVEWSPCESSRGSPASA